jgi:hypothetical protein
MVTNMKTGKTVVRANKMTNEAVKSIKDTRQTLKLKQEAKKQSLKENKVDKTPTNKIDVSKPSATRPIKEPITTKNDPNKRGNTIKFTSDPPSAATRMKVASKKRNLNEKGELLNPNKKTDKGAGIESKNKSKCSKEKSGIIGSMTPPNTSPHANTNTVTEEKFVNGLIPNGGLGHDSTDTNNNGAHTLDTKEVTHDFQYYYSRYCSKEQGPEHQENARRQLFEYLQVEGPPHRHQPTHAYVEGLQKGSPEETTAAKEHQSNEEEINLFCITTPPSKGTQEVVADLSMLGSAEDQGVKVRGRLPSPKILFGQGRGMGGIEEQRKEDPFAVNDKILHSKEHTPHSKSLFGDEESGDESYIYDEDDSPNGGERSRVIKEKITETFIKLPSNREYATSRNLDDREVEDDWDGTYSDNGDYIQGRNNETFVAQPSKGEQAPSRNSNQSINRQDDEVSFNPRKVDKHHIEIYPSDLYINTTSSKKPYLRGGKLFFTNLQELINDPEMRTLNSCLLCQVLYYKVRPQCG